MTQVSSLVSPAGRFTPKGNNNINNKLWKLKKCPYGIADTGRHWYLRVLKEMKSLGGHQAKLDSVLFMWHEDGNLIGIMAIHVDDFLFGGNDFFTHM